MFKVILLFLMVVTMENLNAKRECAAAGTFYSNDAIELSSQIKSLLQNAKTSKEESVQAIIVPHAGYVFSAQTAAAAFNTLKKRYKNIFLIGSSHHVSFDGASIYSIGNYKTPLGEIQTNHSIVSELMKNPLFTYNRDAHTKEHTLEVQLPFLQTIYGDELNIVPIIMATQNMESIIEISKILKPYFDNKDNLFVISTDLSHYPDYEDANVIDKRTLNALIKNNPQEFINTIVKNEASNIRGLVTSACGWSSLLVLLNMTKDENYQYEIVEYKNSGDTQYGEKNRVVGYGAVRVCKSSDKFFLTNEEKEELRQLAKLSLYEATINNKRIEIDESSVSPKLKQHLGAFVTLKKEKQLRGCIGQFEPNQPLYKVIIEMAISAAKFDRRFNQVTEDELKDIEIEISVLTPRKKINSIDEIKIGRDGIYIVYGDKNGTYLPQVATDMNWSVEEFVKSCCEEKAGISPSDCKNAQIFTYEAIVF
ncbi:MAG: TIGR00296 family protein [Epsilonproteobacteria bacterium]|nr:MAG: TIGR00296 family protein [Campylobacterota bacterium]